MRNWQLTASDPLALKLAADTRLYKTDYTDDQTWELVLGQGQSPALAFETRYGGRCGLARLVPFWVFEDQVLYEAESYDQPPVLHTIFPNYYRLTARPIAQLAVQIEVWAMTSHVVGGRFTLVNKGEEPLTVGIDMIAQFMRSNKEGDINILALEQNQYALQMVDVGNLQPVLMMHAVSASSSPRPKLAARITVPAGDRQAIRWVQAGYPTMDESLAQAHYWLYKADWAKLIEQTRTLNENTPVIETGDTTRDAAIAASIQTVLQSFVGPTDVLPHPSFVTTRVPGRGFSPAGTGADYYHGWDGQSAYDAYTVLTAAAAISPALAMNACRNMLATATDSGWIDGKAGMGGQRQQLLAAPLLASLAWRIYEYTDDRAFLSDVYPVLGRFFLRWFESELDRDGDGLPEWTDVKQTGFLNSPLFAPPVRRWAQNANISQAESPGLAALLIAEGESLLSIANALDAKRPAKVKQRIAALRDALATMWDAQRQTYTYRQRDSHLSSSGALIAEAPADQALIPSMELDTPNALVIRVLGGRDHQPKLSILVEGFDANGSDVSETLGNDAFEWYRALGIATTQHSYSRIDRVTAEGLSRVYTLQVASVNWQQHDQALLLPLWAGEDDPERGKTVLQTLTDPDRYWRQFGVPACDATSDSYDPTGQQGCGGAWPFWNVIMGEALISAGRTDLAGQLFEKMLVSRIRSLFQNSGFRQAYNPETGEGLGETDDVTGIVPLHLLWQLMGFRILSDRKVAIGGSYALPWPVRVQQYGVTIERTPKGAKITFPSGEVRRVRSARWRVVEDETATGTLDAAPAVVPTDPPGPKRKKSSKKGNVEVDVRPQTF